MFKKLKLVQKKLALLAWPRRMPRTTYWIAACTTRRDLYSGPNTPHTRKYCMGRPQIWRPESSSSTKLDLLFKSFDTDRIKNEEEDRRINCVQTYVTIARIEYSVYRLWNKRNCWFHIFLDNTSINHISQARFSPGWWNCFLMAIWFVAL